MSDLLRSEEILSLIQHHADDESFYFGDLNTLNQLYEKWTQFLPKITPFYAVKVNPTIELIKHLSSMPKIGFDCASHGEMNLVLSCNIPGSKIINANPCRNIKNLTCAKENGVNLLTFDSLIELKRIKKYHPEASLILRLAVEQLGSTYALKDKYGASIDDAKVLLQQAKILQMKFVGVSFHVGSDCRNPNAYYLAIENSKKIFDYSKSELEIDLTLLDIGGGFTDITLDKDKYPIFEATAHRINQALEKFFPETEYLEGTLNIIAEPGRFFSETVFTLAVSIFGKKYLTDASQVFIIKENETNFDKIMYYVNEGMYSQFLGKVWEPEVPPPTAIYSNKQIKMLEELSEPLFESVVWGPTCDSLDCVYKRIKLPNLQIGDWLIYKHFGAYSISNSTFFNGFSHTPIYFLN